MTETQLTLTNKIGGELAQLLRSWGYGGPTYLLPDMFCVGYSSWFSPRSSGFPFSPLQVQGVVGYILVVSSPEGGPNNGLPLPCH